MTDPTEPTTDEPTAETPPAPAVDGDLSQNALAYLRANRDRFTSDALTERLEAAGYPFDVIDRAWASINAETAGPGSALTGRQTALIVLLVLGGLAAGAVGGGTLLLAASSGIALPILYLPFFLIQVVGVAVFAYRRIARSEALRRGDWVNTVGWLVAPPLMFVFVLGVCYAINVGAVASAF